MRVKPLTGQVLVEIIPEDKKSSGGIDLPEHTLSPEEVQDTHHNPQKPPGVLALVAEIGPWPLTKNGLLQMPEFGRGSTVVIPPHCGTEINWHYGCRLKMLQQSDVLAVIR